MNGGKGVVPGAGEVIAMLGKGSSFEGKLTFEGTVRIDGQFSGEIFSEDTLVIGEGGQVRAEIEVGSLILQGNLVGNVRATDVIDLRAPGRLQGNITAPNIEIEKGVFFEGACTMSPATTRAAGWQPTGALPKAGGPAGHHPPAVPPGGAPPAPTLAPVAPHRSTGD